MPKDVLSEILGGISSRSRRRLIRRHWNAGKLERFDSPDTEIDRPFSFGELIEFIEGSSGEAGSFPLCYNDLNYQDDPDPSAYRSFTTLSSDFYPALAAWMEAKSDDWVEERLAEQREAEREEEDEP